MPTVSDINAVPIALEAGDEQALFILLAAAGSINRLGTGAVNNKDNDFFIGVTRERLFNQLMTNLDDDMLNHMGGYEVPDQKGIPCELSIGLSFANADDNGFGFRYVTMHIFKLLQVMLVSLLVVSSGCGDSGTSSDSSHRATQSSTSAGGNTEGVVKIAVLIDGTVFVNSESVAIDSLASKLDSISDIKEIWYHREAPDAAEPHENAMKAIAEIANRRLPIAMYLDRDFTQRMALSP